MKKTFKPITVAIMISNLKCVTTVYTTLRQTGNVSNSDWLMSPAKRNISNMPFGCKIKHQTLNIRTFKRWIFGFNDSLFVRYMSYDDDFACRHALILEILYEGE